jgi:DNA-binding CsgD family transcriptional regulator
MMDLLSFPAALVDIQGHFIYRNEAHRKHPLWQAEASPGKLELDATTTDALYRQHVRDICSQVAQNGEASFHLEMIKLDGGTARHYRWMCLPLHKAQGTVEHLLFVQLDAVDPPGDLSDRELETFEYLGHGHTTQEIAEAMLISPKTVESYRARIKEKLGLEHNTELIRRAVQWVDGGVRMRRSAGRSSAFLDPFMQEIRSPLAAIAGLADSLALCANPEQAHLAELILTSTQQLIRRLDLEVKDTQPH